ncbi:MAG: DUF4040 domain-containing protein [Lachnospiraceae bacterium]|nr:DUF4040 domain-containing protein [Lachnospiraceae bacterium]
MKIVIMVLLLLMIVCAISVSLTKGLLTSVVIYMSFSMFLSLIWFLLEAADLGITEAAVGAGVNTILFFVTLKKVRELKKEHDEEEVSRQDEQPGE